MNLTNTTAAPELLGLLKYFDISKSTKEQQRWIIIVIGVSASIFLVLLGWLTGAHLNKDKRRKTRSLEALVPEDVSQTMKNTDTSLLAPTAVTSYV
ncbi:hypothetical protein SNEBB_004550 [Seison nebaliae]|nr:hypothetical protein SNEBB_004550 [Seison nebaliae]